MQISPGPALENFRRVRRAFCFAVLFPTALGFAVVAQSAGNGTLPAYAHNDYRNDRPLWDALALGYRGIEVDVFLVDGQLRLGHDREEAEEGGSFEDRYLRPLQVRIDQRGSVHGDSGRFLLNIELKESDPAAFTELRRLLEDYSAILTTVIDGVVQAGPIQIVLVGWHPPAEQLLPLPVRHFGIQRRSPDLRPFSPTCPAHLFALVSIEFRELSRWNGVGPPPRRFLEQMRRFSIARRGIPDRIVRVFEVPRSRAVYRALLASGVDYIGTKTIGDTRTLLDRIESEESEFDWGRR